MKGKIFNAQEVQPIIAGNKTMFREVIKNNLLKSCYKIGSYDSFTGKSESEMMPCNHSWAGKRIDMICSDCWKELLAKCPYQVGQKIFCKESFREGAFCKHHFKADDKERKWGIGSVTKNFLPAQHMKQEHSRLTLQIKEIRVERLLSLSQEDCVAEGVEFGYKEKNWGAKEAFRDNWNATHKKPEEKFEASPFVWCVSFEVVK